MSKVTEAYVLKHCLGNSREVIERDLFPLFQDELVVKSGVRTIGYQTPVYYQQLPTFDDWARQHYVALRKATYAPAEKQLEMKVDGTHEAHIIEVKSTWPKLEVNL